MTVRSSELQNGREARAGALSRRALRRSRTAVETYLAWCLLAASWIGSIVVAHGGWAALLAGRWSWTALALGLAGQGLLTWLQWSYDDVWWVAWPARAVDALLTAAGYGPLLIAILAGWVAPGLAARGWLVAVVGGVTTATAIAWCSCYLVSLFVAWYPEAKLVRE